MKTIVCTFGLFLISLCSLFAQFHFKVSLNKEGIYTVKLKSDVIVNPGSIVGSGQIVLTAPFGGFKIGEMNSVNGTWNSEITSYNECGGESLGKDYFSIKLIDGNGMLTKGISIEEEITLINFRNIGACTGAVHLITPTDKVVRYLDSLQILNPTAQYNYNGNLLSTFDILTETVYDFSGVYDIGEAICDANNSELSTSTENLKLKSSLIALPNPFTHQVLIQFDNPSNKEYQLIINDLSGRMVRRLTGLTGNQVTLQRANMPAGMYLAQLRDEAGNFATTKLIVE